MSDEEYTFNWHDLDDFDDYEEFLRWAVVNLTVDTDANGLDRVLPREEFDRLNEVTKNFTEVTLTVQINGIDVDPQHLMRGIEHNMKRYAREVATEELSQLTELTELRGMISTIEDAITRRARQVAGALGVQLDVEDKDEL